MHGPSKDETKTEIKSLTLNWLLLIALTVLAVVLGQQALQWQIIIAIALLITIFKGKIVADIFMGLIQAPPLWRRLMLSYVILVPAITGSIYLLS